MAKQSGLHQIRGKVGEHSYYRQTGISSGLIRSINQGMSERVKTSEEYANTRLNNHEFGAACNVAGLLGKMVVPKFRPMILPFSQSKMAKNILKLARQNTEQWGQRTVSSAQTAQLAATLSAQSKRDPGEFLSLGIDSLVASNFEATCSISASQATMMKSLGIDRITVYATLYNLATGNWNDVTKEMHSGYSQIEDSVTVFDETVITAGTDMDSSETVNYGAFVPAPGHTAHRILVFVVLPLREIDGTTHVLQEYCSFYAMQLPAYVP